MQVGTVRKTETKAKKAELVKNFGKTDAGAGVADTGSPEVQIALITDRINSLTPHFQKNKKDYASKRGLISLVGKRRSLLNYLKSKDEARYTQVLSRLELRK